jgi:hypothetical protein
MAKKSNKEKVVTTPTEKKNTKHVKVVKTIKKVNPNNDEIINDIPVYNHYTSTVCYSNNICPANKECTDTSLLCKIKCFFKNLFN